MCHSEWLLASRRLKYPSPLMPSQMSLGSVVNHTVILFSSCAVTRVYQTQTITMSFADYWPD